MKSRLPKRQRWQLWCKSTASGNVATRSTQRYPGLVGSSKDPRAGGTLVCNKTENPPLFRALALRRNQTLLTLHSLNMLHSRGFLAEVFGILARHNISVDLITTSEVSVALTLIPPVQPPLAIRC